MFGVGTSTNQAADFFPRQNIGQRLGHFHQWNLQIIHGAVQWYGEEKTDGRTGLVYGCGSILLLVNQVMQKIPDVILVQLFYRFAAECEKIPYVSGIVFVCAVWQISEPNVLPHPLNCLFFRHNKTSPWNWLAVVLHLNFKEMFCFLL